MPILNDLALTGANFAKKTLDSKSSEWFDKLIGDVTNVADGLDGTVKSTAKVSIDVLKSHKADILHLGDKGVAAFIGYIALGSEAKAAQLLFLSKEATLDELLAAGEASNLSVITAKKDADAAKAATIQTIKDIGITVARTLLPLLLAAI